MNATFVGFLAVLVWGLSLPVSRAIEGKIGIAAFFGAVYMGAGLFGLMRHILRKQPFPNRKIFSNPMLYGRWIFFVLHEAMILSAIVMVRKNNVPFVILINYLWPTAIILCSILLAGVKISRWWSFILGSITVIASLSIEILGANGTTTNLFDNATDRLAYGMAFVGAISWGLYCAFSKRAGAATGGSAVIPFFQLTLGLALPLSFLPGFATWENLNGWWPLILSVYCVLQFIAYLCWDFGMRLGNIVILSLGADFIPWLSLLTFSILFNTPIGTRTVLAAILLVTGAMITRYGTLQKRSKLSVEAAPSP